MNAQELGLAIALVLLVIVAFALAAAETSLLRVRRSAVAVRAEAGERRAIRLLAMIDDLPRVLNSVLLAVLLTQVGAATLAGLFAQRRFGSLGVTLATVALTGLLFVYGEAIPKTMAVRSPLQIALRIAGPIRVLSTVLGPLVGLLVRFADAQSPGSSMDATTAVTEEELRQLAGEAASAGEIEASDAELIERSFLIGDLTVDQIVVPRVDVVAVKADHSVTEALDRAISAGHRRLPIYEGDLDNIVGFVRMRDLASAVVEGGETRVVDLARVPLVVPETMRVIQLLRQMQASGKHFAVAVDEYGGTAGIATLEDVVEELVGELDEDGSRTPPITSLGDDRWQVTGLARVDEVAESLDLDLPGAQYETVGRMLTERLGRIPDVGESVVVDDLVFCVTRRARQRVLAVEVRRAGE